MARNLASLAKEGDMKLDDIADLLEQIKGATFISLDSETMPKPGLRCVTVGTSAMLFTNKTGSAYEKIVKRRLKEAGKDPETFKVSDLPWGERIPGTPLIEHKGRYYLQMVVLRPGESKYYVGRHEVNPLNFGVKFTPPNQGLPEEKGVIVNTYALDSITRLSMMHHTVHSQTRREILKLKH